MPDLKSILTDASRRKQVVRDAELLLDAEVDGKSGLSGLAIKGAFKVVKSFRPGIIPEVIDGLLDDFATRLDPFYQAHATLGGGRPLVDYLTSRKGEMADALLAITDTRARVTRHTALKGAYEKLRPEGKKHVEAAIPGVARLIEKHARAAGP
jgi:hypothetical protein